MYETVVLFKLPNLFIDDIQSAVVKNVYLNNVKVFCLCTVL